MKWWKWIAIIPAAFLVRMIYHISRLFKLGEGSNLPGKIVLALFPKLLDDLVPRFRKGWILVTGTNGKTTTTKILVELMKEYGATVVTNDQGANLVSGILTSLLLMRLHPGQEYMGDYAIFEIDEAVLIKFFHIFRPRILVVTNFSRDQLDRYGEVDTNINKIIGILRQTGSSCRLILNGNDPNIVRIGEAVPPGDRLYFGIKNEIGSAQSGLLVEQEIGKDPLSDSVPPELDLWADAVQPEYLNGCRFELGYQKLRIPVELNLPGVYNVLNALAAAGVCVMEFDPQLTKIAAVFKRVEPSYGRSECFSYRGIPVFLFLVKNPVGFNHIIQLLTQAGNDKRIMFLLNDLVADGTDVSWIWDVALENLWGITGIKEIVTSGTRAGDMALRVKYSDPPAIPLVVDYSPHRAFKELAGRMLPGEVLMILANYTAMIKFRPFLLKKTDKPRKALGQEN